MIIDVEMKKYAPSALVGVVAVVIVAAVAWFIIQARQARPYPSMSQTAGNARGIYMLIFAAKDEPPFGSQGAVLVTVGGATKRIGRKELHFINNDETLQHVTSVLRP